MSLTDAFYELYEAGPRQGPGSADTTAQALWMVPELPARPRVLDLGCGSGGQTLTLAALLPDAHITAVDLRRPQLARLDAAAAEQGVADRITTVAGDLASPPEGPWDLIWCEGAAYVIGFEPALRTWAPLLCPGGSIALSEAVWTVPEPPAQTRALFADYPGMQTVADCEAAVARCGLAWVGSRMLPDSDWWAYYTPLEAKMAELRSAASDDMAAVIIEAETEIQTRREHPDAYGYAFIVAQRPTDPPG